MFRAFDAVNVIGEDAFTTGQCGTECRGQMTALRGTREEPGRGLEDEKEGQNTQDMRFCHHKLKLFG